MLLYFLNPTVPHGHQWKWCVSEVSHDCLPSTTHGIARAVSFFQFQTSISNHLEVIFVIGQYLAESSVAACCLQFGIFFIPFCNLIFFLFLGASSPSFRPFSVWSGSLLSHPFTILQEVVYVVSAIFVVPVHSSERLTHSASVHMSLLICSDTLLKLVRVCLIASTYFNGSGNMSHYLGRKASNEVLHDVDK